MSILKCYHFSYLFLQTPHFNFLFLWDKKGNIENLIRIAKILVNIYFIIDGYSGPGHYTKDSFNFTESKKKR